MFGDMDLLAVHRVLVCMVSFIREARSCFENLADFRSEFLVHYTEAQPEDDKARNAALDDLLGKPEWIQKLRDLRHEVSHDRYPWLAFEGVEGPSTSYEPILLLDWRPNATALSDRIPLHTMRQIAAGIDTAIERLVQVLCERTNQLR